MSELKRWKINLDDDYGFHGLERSNGPELEGMKEVAMGDCDLMLAYEVDAELTRLQEKVKQLEGDLVEAKERFETRTIDFNNAYNANISYAAQVRELKAECERLRRDAARHQLKFSDDNVWLCVNAPQWFESYGNSPPTAIYYDCRSCYSRMPNHRCTTHQGAAMTLLKKPKRELCHLCKGTGKQERPGFSDSSKSTERSCVACKASGIIIDIEAEHDYYKAVAEFAVGALGKFVDAGEYATSMSKASALTGMDARDFFMWQAKRKLCIQDFKDAAEALEAIRQTEQPT